MKHISYINLLLLFTTQVFAESDSISAGKTIMALGNVTAQTPDKQRSLTRRAPVFMQDTVFTGVDSRTQMRMLDGGLLSLKAETHLAISKYDFDPTSEKASILLSLIKGGLRTVTGKIDQQQSRYQLQTPVASIGVRGTDYSAQMEEQDLLLAVWQGAIDVQVSVGNSPTQFSLGPELAYSVARVKANGEVEFLLNAPKQLVIGHTSELVPDSTPAADVLLDQQTSRLTHMSEENENLFSSYDNVTDDWVDADITYGDVLIPVEVLTRTGTATFDLVEHSFASSAGNVQQASMSMNVDFDLGRVPSGQLSFTDSQGEWFAVFSGVIKQSSLDLNINFASHGNNLAQGSVRSFFVDNGKHVFGDLHLSEINSPTINAGGTFVLGELVP